jgi:tetratricopeptide (TPR) repeat protein
MFVMNYLVSFHVRSLVISATLLFGTAAQGNTGIGNLLFHPVPLAQAASIPAGTASMSAAAVGADRQAPQSLPVLHPTDKTRDAAIAGYRAAISTAIAREGPYARAIGEDAFALGRLLGVTGDAAEALKAFQLSLQVLRVNHGLYDLQQVPVLRAIIEQHLAQQDIASAHAMQETLFNLQSRHHGDESLMQVTALLEWADWNVSMFLQYEGRSAPFFTSDSDQLRLRLNNPRLGLAYTSYKTVLAILQGEGTLSDPRLVMTERKLAALNFMLNQSIQLAVEGLPSYAGQSKDFNSPVQILEQANAIHFHDGSSALQRAIAYGYKVPDPDYNEIGERMMALGDWYLLFDRRAAALDIYEDALKLMESASLPQDTVERIMSPGMPIQTPDADYLSPAASDRDFAGFIDVQFELGKFGTASNPRIIGGTTDDKHIEKELLRTIRKCKFRPKFVAGAPVSAEQVQLRYYYSL